MRSEKDLLPRVIAFDNLLRAYRGASAGKRSRREVCEFEPHLETRLHEMRRELEAGACRWGPYHRFQICDPKRREIRAPPFRDRVTQHAIVAVVEPLFERGFITDTYACIRGRGQHRAVQRLRRFLGSGQGAGYVLKCDVAGYFRSVDHEVLAALLARRIGDRRLLAPRDLRLAIGGRSPRNQESDPGRV